MTIASVHLFEAIHFGGAVASSFYADKKAIFAEGQHGVTITLDGKSIFVPWGNVKSCALASASAPAAPKAKP